MSASITDEQLGVLSGTTDLATATFLQMTVDSVSPRETGRRASKSCRNAVEVEWKLAAASRARSSSHSWSVSLHTLQAHVPLGTLGERMPKLQQLKLSGSALPSIRELGTSLRNLQILWLCRSARRPSVERIHMPHAAAHASVSLRRCLSTAWP